MSKVNLAKNATNNARLFTLQEKMIAEDNLSFFKAFEAFLDKHECIKPLMDAIKSFKIGDVFRHRVSSCVPQYHGDNFKLWLGQPSAAKTILLDFAQASPLQEYILPENMNDTAIQNRAQSKPMTEQQFWLMLYVLIIEPKLGKQHFQYELSKSKYYIFHVQLDSGEVVAVLVFWYVGAWFCYANRFGFDGAWNQAHVFLFFAPAVA